jgi:hypothetical protein
MISIIRATEKDSYAIAHIGKVSVTEAHRESCAIEVLNEYVEKNYHIDSIQTTFTILLIMKIKWPDFLK